MITVPTTPGKTWIGPFLHIFELSLLTLSLMCRIICWGSQASHSQGSPRVLSTRSPSSPVQLSSPSSLCGCSREFLAWVMGMAQVHSLRGCRGRRRSKMETMLVCPLAARYLPCPLLILWTFSFPSSILSFKRL